MLAELKDHVHRGPRHGVNLGPKVARAHSADHPQMPSISAGAGLGRGPRPRCAARDRAHLPGRDRRNPSRTTWPQLDLRQVAPDVAGEAGQEPFHA